MSQITFNFGLLVITLYLFSCSTLNQQSNQVKLSEQASYLIQAVPDELVGRISLQKLQVTEQDNQHEFLLQTELAEDSIQMVGFSLSGIELFQLTWRQNDEVVVSKSIAMSDIPAQQLLAYYQLSNWPLIDIKNGLIGIDILLSNGNSAKREFFESGSLSFSVTQKKHITQLIHHVDNYQITIETLD
ncbi:MAG: DUF3261 domain-containing protein [Paraglaciecola sp.]|uniref:DUF3261 domain-containing protein n=1 Tax=Paraglaciecola sp. TaxID=1920173 RepID=UPI00329812C1